MAQKRIINRIGRGKYTFEPKRNYLPAIPRKLITINALLKKHYPFLTTCLWSSSFLNEFSIHLSNKTFYIVETEKDSMESIFFFLKDNNYPVFINPSQEVFNNYALSEKDFIIIKPIVSEAPTQTIKNLNTVTLEKMLVDVFCDEIIFAAYQGNEMKTIFTNAYNKYAINENKLLRYANRRGKKKQIINYLELINGSKRTKHLYYSHDKSK